MTPSSFDHVFNTLLRGGVLSQELTRSGPATVALLAVALLEKGRNVVIVTKDRDELLAFRALVTLLTPALSAVSPDLDTGRMAFGDWVCLPPFPPRTSDRAGWADRCAGLHTLRHGRMETLADGTTRLRSVHGLIMTADNLLHKFMPLDFFDEQELVLSRGADLSPELVLEQAVDWGYERVPMVSNPGEVSRRGDILDILPPGMDKPLRLDFFGDVLEDLRVFDPATQRSLGSINRARLIPVHPMRHDGKSKMDARIKRLFQKGLLSENEQSGLFRLLRDRSFKALPGAMYDAATVIEEWIPKNPVWFLPGKSDGEVTLDTAARQWHEALGAAEWMDMPSRFALRSTEDVCKLWDRFCVVHVEPLRMGVDVADADMPERALTSFADLFHAPVEQDRPWQTLVQALRKWQTSKRKVILSFVSARSRARFLKLAEQENIAPRLRLDHKEDGLFALVSPYRSGADMVWDNSYILGEDIIQPHAEKSQRVASGAFRGLDKHDDLAPGDLLVHREYGIARFGGLQRMELGSVANDFMLLHYAGDDKLYLPVDRIALIQRFKGGSEASPTLDRLGGGGWQAGKDKAKKAIEKIAEDLVEMYAWRKVAKGFRYGPPGELFQEFEASFGFEETPDQARAIQEVLADMERPEPMDRLVCGDVGFGKTEVAMRASFRAASEGRQVALLCPTTVLAEQHYQTFRARLSGFAVNVGLLSRFVPPKKQKEVLASAAAGQVDILIGTHRLLSADVVLPNLGLLILDEEQRFGVRHKEKLKQLKKGVDALTLTATPIPRTLQLSISGVRELSVIETAPPERKPVATAIVERDDAVLRTVLEREIAREGQVFWVHNRVQGLERVVDYVKKLVPGARVGMAHGQMSEKPLEEAMHAFWHGELDVLVCTAIVESGLDFPRANTLVVDGAQLFGLGQLYQLRGRVGRSDRQAFAVFVVPSEERLTSTTRDRLRIILDLDYLGAGFQVAMEDLRLRGAGNILGEVQSGHMGRVGLDLYLEMLEQAVSRVRGTGVSLQTETEINLGIAAYIPEDYIADANDRLRWYKRLSTASDKAARLELEMELLDRYGKLPEQLETFTSMLELKAFLGRAQVLKADIFAERLRLAWSDKQTAVPTECLLAFLNAHRGTSRFAPPAILECSLDASLPVPRRLDAIRMELGVLLD